MKWEGRRRSDNVEDARGRQVKAAGSATGGVYLLNFVMRRFGIKGVLVLAGAAFLAISFGLLDPATLTGGSSTVQQVAYQPSPEEQRTFEFVTVVLADTEAVWNAEFARFDLDYREPTLVVYRGQHPTGGCGMGDARMGPFYCPADEKIYVDLGFYDALDREFDAPGDFAQAYVIAHEIGHHIQKLLGTTEKVAAYRDRPDYNQYSVRLELQADYYAGVWAKHNSRYLESGDLQEAMRAANQIGDDAIQRRSQGRVVPAAFTHGTSEQRMRWFNLGVEDGSLDGGDTFSIPYAKL
jgi:predicted metalloprotease